MSELLVIWEIPVTNMKSIYDQRAALFFWNCFVFLSSFLLKWACERLIKKVTWNILMFFQPFSIEVVYNNSFHSNWLFSENIFFESGEKKKKASHVYI